MQVKPMKPTNDLTSKVERISGITLKSCLVERAIAKAKTVRTRVLTMHKSIGSIAFSLTTIFKLTV